MISAILVALHRVDLICQFTVCPAGETLSMVLFPARVATAALGIFGALGILLAVTGIFGLASYTVSRRMKELGIRIALGASHREVLGAALRRPILLLGAVHWWAWLPALPRAECYRSIVYQATPNDPLVLIGVALTMLLVGALATWIPALRVLHVDPTKVLRDE